MLINNGGTASGAAGGSTIIDGGSEGIFTTSAANATLIANGGVNGGSGGVIDILGKTHTGGKARVELFGNGTLLIDAHHPPGVTVGSIEGDGIVVLGANTLTVGTNKLVTTFSGTIKDGPNGVGGSLTKTGRNKLTLTKANTYTGGTTIKNGTILANNKSGSATGLGPVQIDRGSLGGRGTIAGPVTLGTGGAVLIPVSDAITPSNLTIKSTLTFDSFSEYEGLLDRSTGTASEVTALGVTINDNASFHFVDPNSGTLAKGTVFTVINNTSASPIAGTFSNLQDGSSFTSGGNTFQADYQGGTGNDLTLTVQ